MEKSKKDASKKIKYPISLQIISIFSILVILALGIITVLVTYFMSEDVRRTAEENNHTINSRSASESNSAFSAVQSNVFLLIDMLNASSSFENLGNKTVDLFFLRNPEIISISLPDGTELQNSLYFSQGLFDSTTPSFFIQKNPDALALTKSGGSVALNASPVFNELVCALFCPVEINGEGNSVVIFYSLTNLTESFASSQINNSYIVNHNADLILHPDYELVLEGVSYSKKPLIRIMRENNDDNRQILITDDDGNEYFAAYSKLSFGDMAVITTVPSSVIFASVTDTTMRNMYLSAAVLFLAILCIWFWSKTISTPVKNLAVAAHQIEDGNFIVELSRPKKDELGVLTESFVSMGKGLAERERLKDTFGRFINKEIAEKAMRGELTLGGENKFTTIFFSDIRSFTAMSESLEPHEVVEFLNDYMTRMVRCVNATGGVVDKYIGDAIMAVWGAPVSSGSHASDALNCIRSAVMMRAELFTLNKIREKEQKKPIKIGCGINSGPVVAGQIGSTERMEYTVIGDAVNLASRTESLNKPLGTDILITENTYNLIKESVIVEEMPSVTVKGKTDPIRMFAVVNIPGADDIKGAGEKGPKTMAQVRSVLGIAAPDLTKVDVDAEEKKYSIKA